MFVLPQKTLYVVSIDLTSHDKKSDVLEVAITCMQGAFVGNNLPRSRERRHVDG